LKCTAEAKGLQQQTERQRPEACSNAVTRYHRS